MEKKLLRIDIEVFPVGQISKIAWSGNLPVNIGTYVVGLGICREHVVLRTILLCLKNVTLYVL